MYLLTTRPPQHVTMSALVIDFEGRGSLGEEVQGVIVSSTHVILRRNQTSENDAEVLLNSLEDVAALP